MKKHENTTSVWQSISSPKLQSLDHSTQADVCVVGAGIVGLSTAYHLLRQGLKVVVLEGGELGSGQTGKTTAHLTNALDDRIFKLMAMHGKEKTKLAVESHAAAMSEIRRTVQDEGIECDLLNVDGYLFAGPEHDTEYLNREVDAAHALGMIEVVPVSRVPYLTKETRGLIFPFQAQFHPLKYLFSLAKIIQNQGGRIFARTHVQEISSLSKTSAEVCTKSHHRIYCDSVVVATNVPINDRFAIHTKQYPYRTYAIGFSVPKGTYEPALVWDTSDPYHYMRIHSNGLEDIMIVGGEDHKTGQIDDYSLCYSRLETWSRDRISSLGEITHRWSGQVIEPMDGMAFIGRNPVDSANIFIATGDSGQGMTHGTIAGMLLTDLIIGKKNPWEDLYEPSRVSLKELRTYLKENANAAAQYKDWITPGEVKSVTDVPVDSGAVLRDGLKKVAVYKDKRGGVHMKSAACPHLGGVVAWNESEKTWDCPCHGSRFDRFGRVIEGPAYSDLPAIDDEKEKSLA